MTPTREVRVPDIGEFDDVDVIEVLVAPGDRVELEQSLVTLESDKATMEIPAPAAGVVRAISVEIGSQVSEGDVILLLELDADASTDVATKAGAQTAPAASAAPRSVSGPSAAPVPSSDPRAASVPDADVQTEVLVLGSGPGGYTAAFRAADLGKQVVLVERYPDLGGVCLNVGCIPSKALLHIAEVVEETRAMAKHGVRFGEPEFDLPGIRGFKDDVVGKLTGGLAQLAKQRKVEIVRGTGRFESPHSLQVENEGATQRIGFQHCIIAAGSRAVQLPGLPNEDPRVLDSTSALALGEIPERLLVIGGGIIGLELASVFHALGSRVTVVELLPQLMTGADPDLVKPLQRIIEDRYERILVGTRVTGVEAAGDGLHVTFEGKDAPARERFDQVLVAVGRRPNGDQIGAEAAGVEVDERGFIEVDEQQRTTVAHIHAIGDIVGGPMLAHKASHQGKVAAEVIAGQPAAFDARTIPSVAYTDPEVAWMGITETEAKAEGLDVRISRFPWQASGRALGIGRAEGHTKLIVEAASGRVLGGGVVGPHAGDLIAELTLALELGADAEDLALTIHPHPTLSETIALAAEMSEGTITDLYAPRRKKR